MIIAGYEYLGDLPFKNVYYTGIVRDKLGRKMSKSLGNSPDPIELIEKLGGEVVGTAFLIELLDLKGREKIKGYDIYSLLKYSFN